MSKVLPATCEDGVVTVEGKPVTATILSEGVAASTGISVIEEDTVTYLAKTTPDLKTTLERLSEALESIASALDAIDTATLITTCGAGAGTAGPALVATADIAAIEDAKDAIDELKDNLR